MFECPCVSVVSKSFLMNKQHIRHTESSPSHCLYALRLSCSSHLRFERRCTRSQSLMCLPVAMGNAIATHTEPTTKLITAHTRPQRDADVRATDPVV